MITRHSKDEITFCAVSDEFPSGQHPEEGTPLFGERYYISAVTPQGARYEYFVGALRPVVEDEWSEEGELYYSISLSGDPHEMQTLADKLVEAFRSGEKALVDSEWEDSPHGPVYGSAAYEAAEPELVMQEKERDREGSAHTRPDPFI